VEFVVNVAYYITDAVVIFPCIPIILYSPKNDPFIFHWILITLSVFILVAADLGYTFNASINDELLKNIEWLWSFIFSIGYILLSASILWFSKIKQILEYKKFSESLRIEQEGDSDLVNSTNNFIARIENSDQILRTMRSVTEKAEKQIDILVAQYIIPRNEIFKFIKILVELTRKNKSLNIRILLPSPKYDEDDIPSNVNSNISIKYFDRPLSANEITSILDMDHSYILGFESENTNDQNRYFLQHLNSESQNRVYTVLFERMWLLEKSVDFEQISNKMF
jgi:hypothetical protein